MQAPRAPHLMINKCYHVRSNSFPSQSHPSTIRLEQEINKIKTWGATSTSTSDSVTTGLSLLEDLYISLEDLLNITSTQKAISLLQGEKYVEELLDGSVKILDVCGIARDTVLQIKENVQSLQSSLRRRRKGDSSIETSVAEYKFFTKKMKKNVTKLITSLKHMESKFGVSSLLNQDQDFVVVVRVLREVIVMNMSIFQSLLSFLAVSSQSHPSSTRIEQELNKIKTWETASTSTSDSISNGLSMLEDLYISLEVLLNTTSTQKVISHHQGEKFVEDLLDGSIKILDICGITRDTMLEIKENVQSLQSSLRRRKGDSSIETSVYEYKLFTKKMKKNVTKLISSLKHMECKFGAASLLNQGQDVVAVIKVLREVIVINMSLFQSILSFLVGHASKSKATKWLKVAKLMHKKEVSCEESSENFNELQCVEVSLRTLLREGSDVTKMQATHERLEALETAIERIENGLESVFRRLVKARVSLLNIMTQ